MIIPTRFINLLEKYEYPKLKLVADPEKRLCLVNSIVAGSTDTLVLPMTGITG